jgi:transposase-like protein
MRSQWYEFKEAAISLRKEGQSIKTIHKNLGVPVSTLSGWLKNIEISQEHRSKLSLNKAEAWKRAHQKAADWHKAQKALRTLAAKQEAKKVLDRLEPNRETLDLSLAMLLFGNNTRTESSPISSSNPTTLRFVLSVLRKNYGVRSESLRCDLSLRLDQDVSALKQYWAKELALDPSQFKSIRIDKRTAGKPTDNTYKGVCIINFSSVAIQRKLMYLYTLFCERIADVNLGT